MSNKVYDLIVIGGGVVGCAIMRKLTLEGLKPLLLEKGGDILSGASKSNSGILHTGFDAPEESLEHKLVQKGYKEYLSIYKKFNLPLIKKSANVVAWNEEMLDSLEAILQKAHRNNVKNVKIIDKKTLLKNEPYLSKDALGAVHVPGEYVIDSWSSPLAYLTQAVEHGATYSFDTQVISGKFKNELWTLKTNKGVFQAKYVINSAGLYGDKVEEICGKPSFEIRPRKGQFLLYEKGASKSLNSIILPVPTKLTKGVLLASTINGNLIVGPTAQEQDSRDEARVEEDILNDLREKGEKLFPNLSNYTLTSTFAGLRTATNHNDYQIYPTKEKNWICVAGIRSTGLSSSLGIALYVWELMVKNFNIDATPIAKKDIVWPKMPNLSEEFTRDYELENSGEIMCHCENVTKREVDMVFTSKVVPNNLAGVQRRTRVMMGACGGFNCAHRVSKMCREQLDSKHENNITYDVIIIGSGPSSLGVATTLEKSNTNYLVLEREAYIGGIPTTCEHPSFGYQVFKRPMKGRNFIKKLKKKININKFKLNTTVLKIDEDGNIIARNINGLINYKAKKIVLATGCRETTRHARLTSGLRPKHIYTTGSLQRLLEANEPLSFKNPVIIGTEIVSFSGLMSCFSNKAKPKAMIEELEKINSFQALKLLPALLGIPVYNSAKITNINGVKNIESIDININGIEKNIKCDAIIFTGKFIPEDILVLNSSLDKYTQNRILKTDHKGNIENTNIWSCGGMLSPGIAGDKCFLQGLKLGEFLS